MGKIKITQVKSQIRRESSQKKTLQALGLRKMNQVVEKSSIIVLQHLIF